MQSAVLFIAEPAERMAANAEAQEEGEWTIFAPTVAAVAFSFAAIVSEFASMKDATGMQRNLHIALVAVTLFVSWMMTHTTFAFRYAHEYYGKQPVSRISTAAWSSRRLNNGRTISTSCISRWCWA